MTRRLNKFHYRKTLIFYGILVVLYFLRTIEGAPLDVPGSSSWDSSISTKDHTSDLTNIGERMINGKLRAESVYIFDSTSSKSSDLVASPEHIVPKTTNATAQPDAERRSSTRISKLTKIFSLNN